MNFSSLRILVVGDVMIDRYLDGRVERISPEAPVPIMRLGQEDNRLGGAANVALNLKALGATPLLAGLVGADENGQVFRSLLAGHDLSDELIVTDDGRTTTVKTRLVASGQQLLRVDREDTHDVQGAAAGAKQRLKKQSGAGQAGLSPTHTAHLFPVHPYRRCQNPPLSPHLAQQPCHQRHHRL